MWQCGCRWPEPCHLKAECKNHDVHPGWGYSENYQMGRCSWPGGGQSWWKHTQVLPGNCDSGLSCTCRPACDWLGDQQEDPTLKAMIKWISDQKVQDLKHLMGDDANTEEGKTILWEQKLLTLYTEALNHHHMPTGKLEEVLQFLVSKAYWVAAMNECHPDASHQGQQQTLSLLNDWFWWSSMAA